MLHRRASNSLDILALPWLRPPESRRACASAECRPPVAASRASSHEPKRGSHLGGGSGRREGGAFGWRGARADRPTFPSFAPGPLHSQEQASPRSFCCPGATLPSTSATRLHLRVGVCVDFPPLSCCFPLPPSSPSSPGHSATAFRTRIWDLPSSKRVLLGCGRVFPE